MLGGASQEEFQFIIDTFRRPVEQNGGHLWLFGSRARGDHQPCSDVDLLVDGNFSNRQPIGELEEAVEDSNFTYKIDLALQQDLAEACRQNVETDKVPFLMIKGGNPTGI